jgi:hypothetical protein
MLPWARAVVLARENSWPMLAPRWVQPRLGAVLRREKVKRFYLNDFTNRGYIAGFRKWLILARSSKAGEDAAAQLMSRRREAGNHSTVIVFEGLKNYFRDIWHDHGIVRDELLKIVSPPVLEKLSRIGGPFVAMHVRRGDIMQPGLTEAQLLTNKHYTPLGWFVAAAKTIRQNAALRDLPIYVVSDGRAHELAELLAISNCRLTTLGTAIGDILLLSKAGLLFASGHSTFSMWGSYLGRIPALYYPGKMTQNVFPPRGRIFEGEWNVGQVLPKPPTEHLPQATA